MEAIFYDGELTAMATRDRVYLAPEIERLAVGHPLARMVAGMCFYAKDLENGELPGPFDREAAEFFSRCVFIPADEFLALAGRSDAALAAHFSMPPAEIRKRRVDLGLLGDPMSEKAQFGGGQK